MPTIISLAQAKAHLNIVDEADDQLLADKINAAESYVIGITGVTIDNDTPAAIGEATLRLVADLYLNRETSVTGDQVRNVPHSIAELLAPFRVWSF
jgi:uncharacterized phage protein (predicted DNA packaging)